MSTRLQVALLVAGLAALVMATPLPADEPADPIQQQQQQEQAPEKPRVYVTISEETTRIAEPLREDGYVDYIAALNQQASEGVTPENNAAVLLWKATGPGEISEEIRERFFAMLGIPPLPEEGDYFVALDDIAKRGTAGTGLDENKQIQDSWDQLDRAMSRPWSKKDLPLVADWLAANQQPLKLVIEASKRPRRYDPMIAADEEGDEMVIAILLPGLQNQRNLARALVARAMLRIDAGDVDGAWADLLACHRLARLSGQGPTLIDALVGIAIESMACKADQALLEPGRLSAAAVRKIQADLRALPPMPPMVDKLDVAERYMFLDAVSLMARKGPSAIGALNGSGSDEQTLIKKLVNSAARAAVDWDLILRMGNSWYDRLVEAHKKPTRAERQAALDEIDDDIRQVAVEAKDVKSLALSMLGNPRNTISRRIGQIFVALLLPAVSAASTAEDRGTMQSDLNLLGFALAAYHAEHGSYPAKLSELVPDYAAEIPEDIFAAGPLSYKRKGKGYLLYSVGRNGMDDGGRTRDEREGDEDWDDLVVRVRGK